MAYLEGAARDAPDLSPGFTKPRQFQVESGNNTKVPRLKIMLDRLLLNRLYVTLIHTQIIVFPKKYHLAKTVKIGDCHDFVNEGVMKI